MKNARGLLRLLAVLAGRVTLEPRTLRGVLPLDSRTLPSIKTGRRETELCSVAHNEAGFVNRTSSPINASGHSRYRTALMLKLKDILESFFFNTT